MADPKVQQLKLKGSYYLWSYKPEQKSNSGLHFTCSKEAIESFNNLTNAMILSKWPTKKEIELDKTSNLQISICGEKGKSYKSLVIRHDKDLQSGTFEIKKEEEKVHLNLSTDSLTLLNESIGKIRKNEGDYSIGDNTPFWLWWNLEEK